MILRWVRQFRHKRRETRRVRDAHERFGMRMPASAKDYTCPKCPKEPRSR